MGVQKMWGVQQGPCFALDVPRALFESLSWAGAVALCFAIYVAGSSAPSQRTGLLSMSVFEGRSVHAACANMRKEGDGQRLFGLRGFVYIPGPEFICCCGLRSAELAHACGARSFRA